MRVSDATQPGKGEHIRNEVDETVLEKEGHELEAAVLDAEEELAQAEEEDEEVEDYRVDECHCSGSRTPGADTGEQCTCDRHGRGEGKRTHCRVVEPSLAREEGPLKVKGSEPFRGHVSARSAKAKLAMGASGK